jgi:hypothetical protein
MYIETPSKSEIKSLTSKTFYLVEKNIFGLRKDQIVLFLCVPEKLNKHVDLYAYFLDLNGKIKQVLTHEVGTTNCFKPFPS